MVFSLVQTNHGGSNTQIGTATATFAAASAGNLLIMHLASDAYATAGAPSGCTESAGCRQETFLGHYVWWKVATGGETSIAKALSPNGTHCWVVEEWTGNTASPYDISAGQKAQSSAINYTTPAVTPTTGDRLLVGSIGGSHGTAAFTGLSTWLNSFATDPTHGTALADITGAHDVIGSGSLLVTANGSTTYSSGATYTPSSAESRTGILIAFKTSAGAATSAPPPRRQRPIQLVR